MLKKIKSQPPRLLDTKTYTEPDVGPPPFQSPEILQAKADLENHVLIDPSIAAINAPDSNWAPDNSPDPLSAGLFQNPDTGKSGVMTIDNFWDAANNSSVTARMLWNTRKLTHAQAFKYASLYSLPIIIDRNKQIENAWNLLPVYVQDKMHVDNFPDDTYGVQRYLWQQNYDNATIKASQEIAGNVSISKEEYDTIKWSPVDDVNNITISLYEPKADPMRKEYDPRYDPKSSAYYTDLSARYGPKNVIKLLSESKEPYTVPLGRVFWDTGRFTRDQAEKYLNNKGYIEPYKAEPCFVVPWDGSPQDLVRFTADKGICKIEDIIPDLPWGLDYSTLGIAALLVGGVLLYQNRETVKYVGREVGGYALEGAKAGASVASNLIPGKQYVAAKQKEANARGITLTQALREDAGRIYNPVSIVENVAQYQ
jgi:hypothetical protein